MLQHFNRLTPAELERLAILSEEMGEAQQIIGKVLRHGYESYNPTIPVPENENPIINRWMLEKELGDIMWAMRAMCESRDINAERIEKRAQEKGPRAAKYLHHQPIKHTPVSCCGGVGCNSCEPQGRG